MSMNPALESVTLSNPNSRADDSGHCDGVQGRAMHNTLPDAESLARVERARAGRRVVLASGGSVWTVLMPRTSGPLDGFIVPRSDV